MLDEQRAIIEKEGWVVECESPFEIRHEDGSFATGQAAVRVIDHIIFELQAAETEETDRIYLNTESVRELAEKTATRVTWGEARRLGTGGEVHSICPLCEEKIIGGYYQEKGGKQQKSHIYCYEVGLLRELYVNAMRRK